MKKLIKTLSLVAIIISSSFLLSACGKKTTPEEVKTTTKTTKSKPIELAVDEKPYVSLIPTSDGHTLALKVKNIPTKFTTVDYELIYTAKDGNIEIEKGVSGTVKLTGTSFEKSDILLGTASCTNGCKYKYDEGVNGGTLTLTLTTDNKEYTNFETPFVLTNGTTINKNKKITIISENFSINGTATSKSDYFIAIKNFNGNYSVFSNGNGKGKITSIEPTTVTKTDLNTLIGDYTITQ